MERSYLVLVPLLLLLSPAFQAHAQEDEGAVERLENCFHLQAFDSLLEERSPDEFRHRALQLCQREMVYVDNAYPGRSGVFLDTELHFYEDAIDKHKQMYRRRGLLSCLSDIFRM
jgi:hypothetical protein